ncbi:Vacuolar protein sorting-associated protein 18 like protein [Tyrophagus putrescentiae]|nr:Vacuolar protein sorting-associated protein 18 like protein [Tyrophagus putrescentiae]
MRNPELATLGQANERTQVIILLLWLLEISLNQLRRLANRVKYAELSNQEVLNFKVEYNRVEANFNGLLSNSSYKAVLKKNRHITYNLLLAHNNQSVLIVFVETIDDFERLLKHYLAQGKLDLVLSILWKDGSRPLLQLFAGHCAGAPSGASGQLMT